KLGLKNVETWTVDATTLALDVLGRPITNTAMLGTIVKATDVVKLESLIEVVKARFEGKIGELNADLVKKAYEEAKMG
ncbi:2-oxoacid:acceptor oxidoreductase family protein, partial [Candidatus Bathyarchaeota archaeon]|nr:2-oxoacid:acceptor oxidoreductase family protein [Candidatus Bathyarchaeota archaeon]